MGGTVAAVAGSERQTFRAATSWQQRSPGRFDDNIDPVWSQGRAIYGGVVGAGMARAMRHAVQAQQQKALRSISLSFAGPVDGGAVTCTTIRR